MGRGLVDKLVNKSITQEELKEELTKKKTLLPDVLDGVSSSKAAIRYGCAKVLLEISAEDPGRLYPHMDFFIKLLESKYRILLWNALGILANLTRVDSKKKFDSIFEKYYSFLQNDYLVTVANVVGHSSTIVNAKPYLIQRITKELLSVDSLKTGPHLTAECKRVIAEATIEAFDMFFDKVTEKEQVLMFVQKHTKSSRKSLAEKAEKFMDKWMG